MKIDRHQKPKPDVRRKARFREEAREMVAKDRYDRKYGLTVDTAGAIICMFILGKSEAQKREGYLMPAITARGTPAWRLMTSNDRDIKVIAEKTILPLVRLGLIAMNNDEGQSQRLLITDSGRATWKLFLERGGRFPEDFTAD